MRQFQESSGHVSATSAVISPFLHCLMRDGLRSRDKSLGEVKEVDELLSGEDVVLGDEECVGRKRGRDDSEVECESVNDRSKKVKNNGLVDQGEVDSSVVLLLKSSAEAEGDCHSGEKEIVLGFGVDGFVGASPRTLDVNKEFHGTADGKLLEITEDDEELRSRIKAKLKEECLVEMSTDLANGNDCKLIDCVKGEGGSCSGQNNGLEGEDRDVPNNEECSELGGGVALGRKIDETESGSGIIETKKVNENDSDGHVPVTRRVLRSTNSRKSECEKDLGGEQSKDVVGGTGTSRAHMCEIISSEVKEHDELRKELNDPSDGRTLEAVKEDAQERQLTAIFGKELTGKDLADLNGDKDHQLTFVGKEDDDLFADQNIILKGNETTEMKNNDCNEKSCVHNHKIIHEADDGREESEQDGGKKGGRTIVRKKKVRGKVLDGQVHTVRRVLRSNTLSQSECHKDVGEDSGVIFLGVGTGTDECNGSDSEIKIECRQLLDVECTDPPVNEEKQLKRKRGRPPKGCLKGETDTPSKCGRPPMGCLKGETNTPRKRGRPHKGCLKGETDIPRKRGRPFKVSTLNDVDKIRLKVETDRPRGRPKKLHLTDDGCSDTVVKKVEREKSNESRKRGRGRPPKVCKSDVSERIEVKPGKRGKKKQMPVRPREELENKLLDRMTKTDEGAALAHGGKDVQKLPKSKEVCYTDEELEQEKVKPRDNGARKLEKQLVRDKIVDMLLDAGWKIDYRPRNGRAYNDAVYVNPDGRTHWSVTLAYRVLKDHYDKGGDHSATCKPGFKFTPLSDEEIEVLRRVVGKERCDKNKKKKDWRAEKQGLNKAGAQTKPKGKQKLNKRIGSQANPSGKMTKCKKRSKHASSADQTKSVRGNKHRNNTKRYGLKVRNTIEPSDCEGDSYLLYNGKRTVLSWMIDLGSLLLDAKVEYLKSRRTRTTFTGTIVSDGIRCDCCSGTFTIPQFSKHAGGSTCDSHNNTYLDDGRSLLQCQLDSWLKQDEPDRKGYHFVDTNGDDPNDDTCGICGDGGDLICCDGCPSTFHQSCLGFENFPSGFWNCIYCCCKFCGEGGEKDPTAVQPLLQCSLCEESYHISCAQKNDSQDDDPRFQSFCGKNCQQLYERLQLLLGIKHELEDGFSWTLVRRFDVGTDISLNEMPRKVECNSKAAVALQIMDECFLPMADHRSGVNLIRNVVYNFGSNFTRLNYSSFVTVILERGDEMISAASIRIHGNHAAEMPFIGTRHMYRRQGMCRRLLSAIETVLSSLNVERLVIPAISELRETWTSVFGFSPLERTSCPKIRNTNMLVFPRVDMLQKPVLIQQSEGDNSAPAEGSKLNDSDVRCPAGFDLNSTYEPTEQVDGSASCELGPVESCLPPDVCLNSTSDLPHNLGGGEPHDQIGEAHGNVEKNSVDIHNPISLGDATEQSGEVSEPVTAVADERKLESGAELKCHGSSAHAGSESLISHAGSESGNCGGQIHPAEAAAPSEVNLEEKIVDLNLTLHEPSVDAEQVMDDERCGLPACSEPSSSHDIHQVPETKVLPDEIPQSRSTTADHNNDESNIPVDHQIDSCHQTSASEAHEKETQSPPPTNEPSQTGAPDTTMEPQCQLHKLNITELSDISIEVKRDAPSLIKQPQQNAEDKQPVNTDAGMDIDSLTQRSLEPMCSSSRSGPVVGIHLPDLGAVPSIPQQ
ncbi:Increased DNA methylation 1 [Linum perenne]